ncbi:hypothetical protein ACFLSE_09450, partial [Bacteroidota bacterium]
DDDGYTADETAMLDVMSTEKGMLVPRMSTAERELIGLPGSPATGLLVYDTDFNNFFYYNGITWLGLPQVGDTGFGGPLFHVVNSYGDTIFAVYDDGVEIIVPTGVKGKVGGFAVSGRSPSKAEPDKYMLITPDSSRIYFDESATKGKVGGFVVSGRSPSKGVTDDYMVITPDSARIYINDTVNAKGSVGGFAISGRSPSKGTSNDIFFATVDSTRIYVDETAGKGTVGGFAVSGRSPSKATTNSFLNLSSKNYFIGHNSGANNTTGDYNFFAGYNSGLTNTTGSKNIFLGYESGYSNIGDDGPDLGNHNIFIGYRAGYNNNMGFNNIFLGYQSGYNNLGGELEQGSFNTFIGYESGFENQIGGSNTFLGYQSGQKNYEGNHNTYLGRWAGADNTEGSYNVFVGTEAGRFETGSNRLCINAVNEPGYMVPLIYGEFDNRNIVIDGDANDNPGAYKLAVTGPAGGTTAWLNIGKKSDFKSFKLVEYSLDKVKKLNGISFIQTDRDGKSIDQIGIDPESAIKVVPGIVKDYGEYYGIEYAKLTVLLIEAIKEQQKQIEELQKLIQVKETELQETNNSNDQINLLIEENKKLKQDIAHIMELLQSIENKE